jgi:hypothetical protein
MLICARQHSADGYATASGVEMQFVAFPTDLKTLCVFLRACGADGVQLREHFLKRLPALALQWA